VKLYSNTTGSITRVVTVPPSLNDCIALLGRATPLLNIVKLEIDVAGSPDGAVNHPDANVTVLLSTNVPISCILVFK